MNEGVVNQGWQCPVCKRVYSPTMTLCPYCNPDKTVQEDNTVPKQTLKRIDE